MRSPYDAPRSFTARSERSGSMPDGEASQSLSTPAPAGVTVQIFLSGRPLWATASAATQPSASIRASVR